mmetsp:Transcript_73127/g.110285  ORF Transcript_73127/g.110285 Transcript_73127/m.110285 type:complete len:109 (-) Transcript_73127:229-555(-)
MFCSAKSTFALYSPLPLTLSATTAMSLASGALDFQCDNGLVREYADDPSGCPACGGALSNAADIAGFRCCSTLSNVRFSGIWPEEWPYRPPSLAIRCTGQGQQQGQYL